MAYLLFSKFRLLPPLQALRRFIFVCWSRGGNLLCLALAAFGCAVLSPTVFAQTTHQATPLANQPSLQSSLTTLSAVSEESLIQQSRQLYETGQFDQSILLLEQAIAIFQSQGDHLRSALAFRNLALIYQHLGQWPEAAAAISNSLEQLSASSSENRLPVLARTLDMQGQSLS